PATSISSTAATRAIAVRELSAGADAAVRWLARTLADGQGSAGTRAGSVVAGAEAAVVGGAVTGGGAGAVAGTDAAGAGAAGAGTARLTTRTAGAGRGAAAAGAGLAEGALACSGRRKISVTYSTLPAQ